MHAEPAIGFGLPPSQRRCAVRSRQSIVSPADPPHEAGPQGPFSHPCQHLAAIQSGSPRVHQARRSSSHRAGRAVLNDARSPPSLIHLLEGSPSPGNRPQSPAHLSIASPWPADSVLPVSLTDSYNRFGLCNLACQGVFKYGTLLAPAQTGVPVATRFGRDGAPLERPGH